MRNMRLLFHLVWIALLTLGIYLRKKNIVKVPLWVEISSVVLLLVAFYAYIFFIP